eukprot:3460756-Rhodomonas_salina.1
MSRTAMGMMLRMCYAISGTDMAYGVRCSAATAYCDSFRYGTRVWCYGRAMRRPVLTERMVLRRVPTGIVLQSPKCTA